MKKIKFKTNFFIKTALLIAIAVASYILLVKWSLLFYSSKNNLTDPLKEIYPNSLKLENDVFILHVNKETGSLDNLILKDYRQKAGSPELLELFSAKRPYSAMSEVLLGNSVLKFKDAKIAGNSIILTLEDAEKTIKNIYSVDKDSYLIKNKIEITNKTNAPLNTSIISKIKGNLTSHFDESGEAGLFNATFVGGAVSNTENKFQKIELDGQNFEYAGDKDAWVGFLNHYFLSAWLPKVEDEFVIFAKQSTGNTGIFGTLLQKEIASQQTYIYEANLYAGPKKQELLDAVNETLGLSIDYGWLWFLSVLLMKIMKFFHSFVGNWGLSIVLLVVVLKILFFKLNQISYRSMAKMKLLAPKLKELKERLGDSNKEQFSKEMMQLYQKEKVNPFSGCFPILLQMPVFIALYWMLYESIEMRQVAFLWAPDLATFDPYFIFPLIMGGGMFLQQILSPASGDPQQVKMLRLMPIIFTFLFLWFPAGVTIYWATNNTLSLLQQYIINRQMNVH